MDYSDPEEYSDYDMEDTDSDDDADPEGIMMDSPDLRLRLQNLGEDLQQFGEHVRQQVREGNRVLISSQGITSNTARVLLGEERFNEVDLVTNPETELMLSSYGREARIYWRSNADEYRQWSSNKRSKIGRRITNAAGPIRNQEGCRICWSFGATDLISAVLWLDGWENRYKSLSPMHLCRKVAPLKRKKHTDKKDGFVHYCYGHNVDDALHHVMEEGIPNVEWDERDKCYAKSGYEDDSKDRYYVRRIFRYQTLGEALERLRTHAVTATLACYSGWEERKVYRGPLKQGAKLEGTHQILMLHCREMGGELVVKCKLSNGKEIGFMGYIFVSLEVMEISVGALRREGKEIEICPIRPQHLLSEFYSVEMSRTKASKEEESESPPPSESCTKRKRTSSASHVLKSKAFFKDQSQIYNKVAEHQSPSRVDDHQVRQFVEKCHLPASSRPNSLEFSVDSAFLAFNKASQDKNRLDVGANLFIGNLDPDVDDKLLYDTFSAFGVIASNPKIMHDPETGNSRGFGFISYDSFEASDAAIEAMTGQYLCNRQMTVSYAYKKDTKGERHGTPEERLLAATNPSSQKSASGPPSHPNAPQANGIPRPFANGGMQPVPMLAPRPTPPPPPPQAYQQQQQHGLAIPPPQFRPTQILPPPPPPQFLHHQ